MASSQKKYFSKLDTLAAVYIGSLRKADKEKVFVHADKLFYTAGDDIWLRAYCIGALSHKPTKQSKSLFVDVVSDHDSLVNQIMLNNGLGNMDGRINLPATLPEGIYWLRAYTRRQVQKDSLSISVQPLYVSNGSRRSLDAIAPKVGDESNERYAATGRPSVKFYPEGGVLIAGAETKMVFKAFDHEGKPLEVFGYVTDNSNAVVAKYGTSMPGIGLFSFFAAAKMHYTAHTVYDGSKVIATVLPEPDADGYQLSVNGQSDDSVYLQVSLGDSVYKKFKPSYVLGVSRDSLCYAAIGIDMYTFAVAKRNFPSGKASLLLFDNEQKIVSQRDLYISKPGPDLSILPDRSNYGRRQEVSLSISAENMGDGPDPSVFSIAVTNERVVNTAAWLNYIRQINQDNIDFPGKDIADSVLEHYSPNKWELVMLAQPCRYLGWNKGDDSNSGNYSMEKADSEVVILTGRVLGKKNQPVKQTGITLVSNNGEYVLETFTTDENGRFKFRLPDDILDSTKLFFQVSNPKGIPLDDSIAIDSMRFPQFRTPLALKRRFSGSQTSELADLKLNQLDTIPTAKAKGWLKPAYVTKREKAQVTYDASKIVSHFSQIIPGDKIGPTFATLEYAILSTPGISLLGGRIMIHGSGIPDPADGSTEPLLLVDGFQVNLSFAPRNTDPLLFYLESLNPRNIDFIEVLEGADAILYGRGSDRGVVYVHMLNGNRPDPEDEKKGLKRFYARGYFAAPLFPQPEYDNPAIKNSPYPDQRSTIYWKGNIGTDANGNVKLHFFTADDLVNYKVSVVGLTPDGKILSLNTVLKR